MSDVTILVDGDIVAYQATAGVETKYDWGDTGGEVKACDFKSCIERARAYIDHAADTLGATAVIVCLSDEVHNFRNEVWPPYKQMREDTVRPERLYDLKDWLATAYPSDLRSRMEADDVMGILATEPHEGRRIIVSEDKDMQTIPGWFFNPAKHKRATRVSQADAQRFMLWQGLTGDPTDGYKGCPGVGPAAADLILDEHTVKIKNTPVGEYKSGPRKGQPKLKTVPVRFDTLWEAYVVAYKQAGLGEKEAIREINLARILKFSDMDGSRIIPWVPSMLQK